MDSHSGRMWQYMGMVLLCSIVGDISCMPWPSVMWYACVFVCASQSAVTPVRAVV